jgi:hypothetical protein
MLRLIGGRAAVPWAGPRINTLPIPKSTRLLILKSVSALPSQPTSKRETLSEELRTRLYHADQGLGDGDLRPVQDTN